MKSYRHDWQLFIAIPAVIGICIYVFIGSLTFEGEMKGGDLMRYGLAAFTGIFACVVSYLFVRFGLVQYHLTDDGILVKKLFGSQAFAWDELASLNINKPLKCFWVRTNTGHLVLLSSWDYFRNAPEFAAVISTRIKENSRP